MTAYGISRLVGRIDRSEFPAFGLGDLLHLGYQCSHEQIIYILVPRSNRVGDFKLELFLAKNSVREDVLVHRHSSHAPSGIWARRIT